MHSFIISLSYWNGKKNLRIVQKQVINSNAASYPSEFAT